MSGFLVRKVAVLGAGVMGAQIAAQLVNCRVPVVLFDLPAKEGDKNAAVHKALANLQKLKPAPLGVAIDAALIQAANYDDDLDQLKGCDLIIEAIAERLDWKESLYQKIAPFVAPQAILATNTSGLSINSLASVLPAQLQSRFCGIHFFNPPRYMALVELIATAHTAAQVLDDLEGFVTSTVGKSVVRAQDTPNFVANRIGIANILATAKLTEQFGLTWDVADDLTGKKLGRASSATYRTADVVGLDTLNHVIKTLQDNLSAATDPFYPLYATPAPLAALLEKGFLGQKTGSGFYKKVGKDILNFDPKTGDYVAGGRKADDIVVRMLKKPANERLKLLREASNPQAQFVWSVIREGLHYAALHLADIAETARDVDEAMRWGFGMAQGPFELWQEAGWQAVAQMIAEDIAAGKTLCNTPLPAWVLGDAVLQAGGVHTPAGSWSARDNRFMAKRQLPVYARQYFPDAIVGTGAAPYLQGGKTVKETEAYRLWTMDRPEAAGVLIFTFKTKMHAISPDLGQGLMDAIDLAEREYQGLVIWNGTTDTPFSAGADLQAMLPAFMMGGAKAIEPLEKQLQDAMLRVRYAQVPVVVALRNMVLGGGCELAVHAAKRVAAMESYIGLVEVGVGLLPGGGGLTYIARRAAEQMQASTANDILPFLTKGFTAAAMASVGTGALESRQLGYLLWSDTVVPNKDELLFVAIQEAKALHTAGYRPPMKRLFPVGGRSAKATIQGQLINMRDGGFISEHDFHIASLIAGVVTGGEVDAGTLVDEEYLMKLERTAFCSLLEHPKTQARIMAMLQDGKPLRN